MVVNVSLDDKLRVFPKQRQIPEKKPKTFILFPFELNAKTRETFEEKESESLHLIKNHLQIFKKCYVVSSHGKDSIVLVHLLWRACKELGLPMVDVFLNNTLNIYKEEKAYWKQFNTWLGIEEQFREFLPPKDKTGKRYTVWSIAEKVGHLPSFRRTAGHRTLPYKHPGSPECCDLLKKQSVKDYLKTLSIDERYDCVFVGTRAEESQNRRLGVLQRCRSYDIKTRTAYPIRAVTPLSFWNSVDVLEYFTRYNIPKNPTYAIHNMERMGCASCPAHKNWEIRLASDPTEEGFGMLMKNMEILEKTEPDRLQASILTLKEYVKSKKSNKHLTEKMRVRLLDIIKRFDKALKTFEDYESADRSEAR